MARAPEFRLKALQGEWISLTDTLRKGRVLLVFLRHLA